MEALRQRIVAHVIRLRLEADSEYARVQQTWFETKLKQVLPTLHADIAVAWRALKGSDGTVPSSAA